MLPERSVTYSDRALILLALDKGSRTQREIMEMLCCSDVTARLLLNKLMDDNLVERLLPSSSPRTHNRLFYYRLKR